MQKPRRLYIGGFPTRSGHCLEYYVRSYKGILSMVTILLGEKEGSEGVKVFVCHHACPMQGFKGIWGGEILYLTFVSFINSSRSITTVHVVLYTLINKFNIIHSYFSTTHTWLTLWVGDSWHSLRIIHPRYHG